MGSINWISGSIIRPGDTDESLNADHLAIKVFPNPANEILTVHVSGEFDNSSLKIFNLVGQQLTWLSVKSDYTDIDVRNFEKGIYFLVYESDSQRIVNKFVKD